MAIEKCINEFDVGDVIFEEGSTGRELFVVLDGEVEIAKVDGASKTVIVTLGKGEFFGEMAVIDGSSRSATAIAAAPHTRVMRINHARFVYLVSQQPAFALMIMDALSKRLRVSNDAPSARRPIHERPQALARSRRCSTAKPATLIQATEDVYQIRFKNRAANAYLVRGSKRTIMIDVGLSSNYPHLLACLNHVGITPDKIDMVVLSHEHLDHIGAAYHFHGRSYHRRASACRQQDHAARRFLDAAQDVRRAERPDRHRPLARGRQPDRPRQFPPQRDVHAGPHLGLHHAVRAGQGPVVRRRHA